MGLALEDVMGISRSHKIIVCLRIDSGEDVQEVDLLFLDNFWTTFNKDLCYEQNT